jgi:hypothetical protein
MLKNKVPDARQATGQGQETPPISHKTLEKSSVFWEVQILRASRI